MLRLLPAPVVAKRHSRRGLSPFIREAIVGVLLGRGSLPERPEIMGVPSAVGLAWENGEAVLIETVEEAAFDGLGEVERILAEEVR
jgi:hypothetical protein